VRLRASLLGIPLGELTIGNDRQFGRVLDLSIGSSWLSRTVAATLVQQALALAGQADWRSLLWELPPADPEARAFARWLGFQPCSDDADERRFRLPADGAGA
jgi:hypothetical protein